MKSVTDLFKIKYPIIQGGMVWCSGYRLASAVSNCGGLGLIGAGSMHPDTLEEHIIKCKSATHLPFGVNIPLIYPEIEKIIALIIKHKIKIVFTSAGNPALYTQQLKAEGITVTHVVSNSKFAEKAEKAGADAVVAEGFEAGGHNGREETTTLCLLPEVIKRVNIPVIAAGGIASGKAIAACFALGAKGVQIGSLFAASQESSAHQSFKELVVKANEGDTELVFKKHIPVRLLKNKFYADLRKLENSGADTEALKNFVGKGRSKKGMFEGETDNGELEIGQSSSQITSVKSVNEIMQTLIAEYNQALNEVKELSSWR
ncbi:MAG: nitronate monooxygenase [Bacteroidia bacterium]|nr:nitronate monooxygenase [Bacteroidia bacterium]